jgi:hypothetical protein
MAALIRHRVAPDAVRAGDVLITLPGDPTVTKARTTRKGNIEVYLGSGRPLTLPIDHVWVGR